jgi:hypothetical protein
MKNVGHPGTVDGISSIPATLRLMFLTNNFVINKAQK